MSLLKVEGLVKTYGRRRVVDGIDFEVADREIVGLLGPNGAGKTTFVKTLLGIIRKTSGDARVFGLPAGSLSARQKLGYLPERLALPSHLTGDQCLEYCGGLSGMSGAQVRRRRDEMLNIVGLNGWGDKLVRKYSKGMMQRLGLAQALLHQPNLLILDEPTDGLDPKARAGVREILHRLADRGVTIFLNSHLLQEVEQICQDVAIMAEGTLRYCGPVDKVATFIDQSRGIQRGLEMSFRISGTNEQVEAWKQQVPELATAIQSIEGGQWEFSTGFPDQQRIDQTVDSLRHYQISIHSMEPRTTSLEDSFLHLVGHDGNDSDSSMAQAGKRT